jgi:prepilin-type N-terminal cleavage/methylation domain-containing protein
VRLSDVTGPSHVTKLPNVTTPSGRDAMRTRSPSQAGFSFVEILIVMAIIGVLSGLVVVAINMVSRKKPEFETETRMAKLVAAANHVKLKWGTYPPATLSALAAAAQMKDAIKKVPNRTNEGIESLVQAMYWNGVEYDPQLAEAEFVNTDDDQLEKAVGVHGRVLHEIVDGWGNPIVYIPFFEYGAAEKGVMYNDANGHGVPVRPWKTENGFENPVSFQVFSFGPDGAPNTDDDVKGW